MQLEKLPPFGDQCDKRRNKQTSDEIEFMANGFNAVFRAINKYETTNEITHDTRSAANLAIFPSNWLFFKVQLQDKIESIALLSFF